MIPKECKRLADVNFPIGGEGGRLLFIRIETYPVRTEPSARGFLFMIIGIVVYPSIPKGGW